MSSNKLSLIYYVNLKDKYTYIYFMRPHYKPIPSDESKLFQAVIQENEKEFEYPWHHHPEYELTYILTSAFPYSISYP
jgi:hypothetical protein